ncbi:hypothetical protein CTI12_AA616410 [Artemisia annua]|uniref:Uncharacterized protein n=1 Tax=Artemisia annua TaxID=35608 RepID=A0A2U1KD79_ARTAN|nr:hypothetical protein CTI12_AA616410 [Artemisia annua]
MTSSQCKPSYSLASLRLKSQEVQFWICHVMLDKGNVARFEDWSSDQQNRFSEPLLWIGIYIALASLICVFAMVADLLHGFRNRKLWFPCRFFTLNAASLSVIAVAMKLPMDLNNSMPGHVDQVSKLGSMAFMCTMMANLLPSLATMTNKELFTNIIALGVLVITLVVNVCIQINTGVLTLYINNEDLHGTISDARDVSGNATIHNLAAILYVDLHGTISDARDVSGNATIHNLAAILYVVILLMLLIIHACSSLAIVESKRMLESRYQAGHETALRDPRPERLSVYLRQHVRKHWIMAETSSPQFIAACSATSSASGIICAASALVHIVTIVFTFYIVSPRGYTSDYKWSMLAIFIIQSIGVILGTIAPLFRCFADLSFEVNREWIWNHINVLKVEKYWTRTLSDWKQSSISFSFRSRKCKIFIHISTILVLSFCIGIQKTTVVACKMIRSFKLLSVICGEHCFRCWRSLKAMLVASRIPVVGNPELPGQNIDLRQYVLQLQDDMELAEKTLKNITRSVNLVIVNAENHQPNNLMNLIVESNGFAGVGEYDSLHVPPLNDVEYLDCWSLPLVTLTTIAISLPEIPNDRVDGLLISVSEGLAYVKLVEDSLNSTNDYVRIQKAAKKLWLEVELYNKWLGNQLNRWLRNELQNHAPDVIRAREILQWFRDEAQIVVNEVGAMDIDGSNERAICANSMYRITQTILDQGNIDEVSQENLFSSLLSMISQILAACLTNLPQVITTNCHTNVIEKREASVHAAAELLGQTTEIIDTLNGRELPDLNGENLAFIGNWRRALNNPFPQNP